MENSLSELDSIMEETLKAMFLAILRIAYGVRDAHFINNDKAIVFKTKSGEVKYITPQLFDYYTKHFVFNRETFEGEKGVIILTHNYAAVVNVDKLKEILAGKKKFIKKNEHGDWYIEMLVVKDAVSIVAREPKNDEKKDEQA